MGKLKVIIGVIAGLPVVLLLAAALVLPFVNFNHLKPDVIAGMKVLTGRDMEINGPLNLHFSLNPRITADYVSLSNVKWGTRKEMITAKRLEVQFELDALLSGEVKILLMSFSEPDLYLETNADGRGNWHFVPQWKRQAGVDQERRKSGPLMINNLWIADGDITYLNGETGELKSWKIDLLEAEAGEVDGPVSMLLRGDIGRHGVEVTGQLDSYRNLLSAEPMKVDLLSRSRELSVAARGAVDLAAGIEGYDLVLDVTVDELSHLLDTGTAQEERLGRLNLKTGLRGDASGYLLNDLALELGKHKVKGDAHLSFSGRRPVIKGRFSTSLLDLKGSETTDASQDGRSRVFSSEPIDLLGLRGFDADISLQSSRVLGPRFSLNDLSMKASLKEGVLRVSPASASVGGGKLKASMDLDVTGKVAVVNLQASGKSLGLGRMLKEAGRKGLLTGGASQVDLKLRGRGNSVAALMAGLSGKLLLNIGPGRLNNQYLDLAGADLLSQLLVTVNPVARKETYTHLECAVANLDFSRGVAEYDGRVAAETDKMTLVSSGKIDLRREQLDVGMNPKPRKDSLDLGIGAGDLVSTARVQGSFANPELGLDATNTAKTGIKLYTAIATGGASLLVGSLYEKATADPSPCRTAMGLKLKNRGGISRPGSQKRAPLKAPQQNIFDRLAKRMGS
ncbi:MAG: AsmA family protein [Candidatus Sedimenticola sp. 6PFRAG1]